MKITMSADHLARYRQIAMLFWKYGRSDLVRQMGIDESLAGDQAKSETTGEASPAQLADDLEAMGPTYVKVGQVLASRPDLLLEPYLKALARLQDNVKPFGSLEAEEIVAAELGVRVSKAFASFTPIPIAAASLGQVHCATGAPWWSKCSGRALRRKWRRISRCSPRSPNSSTPIPASGAATDSR